MIRAIVSQSTRPFLSYGVNIAAYAPYMPLKHFSVSLISIIFPLRFAVV